MSRSDDELLQIALDGSDSESLDVIKLTDGAVLLVISERGPVQRRTVVKISQVDAIRLAKFIVGISDGPDEGEGEA